MVTTSGAFHGHFRGVFRNTPVKGSILRYKAGVTFMVQIPIREVRRGLQANLWKTMVSKLTTKYMVVDNYVLQAHYGRVVYPIQTLWKTFCGGCG